jgi:hypothetical protein
MKMWVIKLLIFFVYPQFNIKFEHYSKVSNEKE